MVSKTAALVAPAPPESTGKPARVEASPAQTTMGSVDDGGTRRRVGCQNSRAQMASITRDDSRRPAEPNSRAACATMENDKPCHNAVGKRTQRRLYRDRPALSRRGRQLGGRGA